MSHPAVVKVGGSLFDLPDLGSRLRRWMAHQEAQHFLLVPGGGRTADVIRQLDRLHHLGEECAHWLALRAMTLNASFLGAILPGTRLVEDRIGCEEAWRLGKVAILDAYAFLGSDEARPDHLPHSWSVSSDSVAARAAQRFAIDDLVLLKSVPVPEPIDWHWIRRSGVVDPGLESIVQSCELKLRLVHFRDQPT